MFKITVQIAYTSNLPALTGLYATQKAENMHPLYTFTRIAVVKSLALHQSVHVVSPL